MPVSRSGTAGLNQAHLRLGTQSARALPGGHGYSHQPPPGPHTRAQHPLLLGALFLPKSHLYFTFLLLSVYILCCFSAGPVFSVVCSGSLNVTEEEPFATEYPLFTSVHSGVCLCHSTETASSSCQRLPMGLLSADLFCPSLSFALRAVRTLHCWTLLTDTVSPRLL